MDEQIAKNKEEIAKRDEEIAKRHEEIAKYSVYSLEQFWVRGLSGLELISNNGQKSFSAYTSTHADVHSFEVQQFSIFENIETHDLSWPSTFLFELHGQNDKKRIFYFGEREIEYRVRQIIQNVLQCLGIMKQVWIHYQATLVSVAETDKSDIFVVETQESEIPIAVIAVKQPGYDKLVNAKVLGEVFDYMSNLRNSFGQCEVFGIVTTLDQWRVVWFPDTDEFAASEDMNPPKCEDLRSQFPVQSTLHRVLHGSDVYNWDSPHTLPLIGTAMLKSMRSRYRAVSLLSSQRAYIILRELNWDWGTISEAALSEHTELVLTLPQQAPSHLTVLRQFYGGADGQVCLALTEDFNLVVVKIFYEDELCVKEFEVWRHVYGVDVLCTKLLGSQCLIMPLVFHCIEEKGEIRFDFNVANLSRDPSSGLLSDERFDVWTTRIAEFMRSSAITITADKALDTAVEELALHCRVHNDLEWRHVAFLPVLRGNEVTGMKPVLIDLATVETVESVDVARESMQESKANLLSELEKSLQP
jgi:hypothetical protein